MHTCDLCNKFAFHIFPCLFLHSSPVDMLLPPLAFALVVLQLPCCMWLSWHPSAFQMDCQFATPVFTTAPDTLEVRTVVRLQVESFDSSKRFKTPLQLSLLNISITSPLHQQRAFMQRSHYRLGMLLRHALHPEISGYNHIYIYIWYDIQ